MQVNSKDVFSSSRLDRVYYRFFCMKVGCSNRTNGMYCERCTRSFQVPVSVERWFLRVSSLEDGLPSAVPVRRGAKRPRKRTAGS